MKIDGIGVVVRDNQYGYSLNVPKQTLSIFEVEARTAMRVLKFALEIEISSAIIEGDYQLVINPLHLPPLVL